MSDREKVIKGLELCTNISQDGCLMLCPYKDEKDETYSGFCEQVLKQDALDLLKEQETTSTAESRLFHCEKCGYGIDDIYLSNEHDFDVYPHFCPNCGRKVK